MKAGYKQTDVGVIPEDWDVQYLHNIVDYMNGKAHERNISHLGKYSVVNSRFISTDGTVRKYSNHSLCPTITGDVLMVMSDIPNGKAIAKCYWIDADDIYTVNQRICRLRPRNVNGKLLFYKLNRNPQYLAFDDGVKQTNLRKSDVLGCTLALPKLHDEQQAIATALSDVDQLIASLDQLIAKKRDLKQAAMQQLLTGKTRLQGFSGEWETKRLGNVAKFYKGKGLPKSAISASGTFGCIHYGELFTTYGAVIGEINSRTNSNDAMFLSASNDVLMPTSDVTPNGLAKASCINQDGVILGGDILIIRSDKEVVKGEFLSYLIRYEDKQVLQLVTGSTVYHLYASDMSKFILMLPTLNEQSAIVEALLDMDAELCELEQRRNKTIALKQGMMQELLTGRTRLV